MVPSRYARQTPWTSHSPDRAECCSQPRPGPPFRRSKGRLTTRLSETSQLASRNHVEAIQFLKPCLCDCDPGIDCFAVVDEVDFVVAGDSKASRLLKFSRQLQDGFAFLSQHEEPKGVTFQEAIERNRHTHLFIDTRRKKSFELRANHRRRDK